jgi:uncharacterized protein YjiS (DUF1127 family)
MLVLTALFERVSCWWAYRRTLRELSLLTDRDLYDLGLNRAEIRKVARQSSGL